MKNYIGFINDHSGSMSGIKSAAMADYNANIVAVKDAATREMLDTVVSVVGIGYPNGNTVTRQVVISNPHVLKPITSWSVSGGTPITARYQYFETREDARLYCATVGKVQSCIQRNTPGCVKERRWFV